MIPEFGGRFWLFLYLRNRRNAGQPILSDPEITVRIPTLVYGAPGARQSFQCGIVAMGCRFAECYVFGTAP